MNPSCQSLNPPFGMLLVSFGQDGPSFSGKKQWEGGQVRTQLQVALEINKAIKLLLFPSVKGNSS